MLSRLTFLFATAALCQKYDPVQSLLHLQFARASFCTQDRIKHWDCGEICEAAPVLPGLVRNIGPGDRFDVRGFVARMHPSSGAAEGHCVVSFRGSISFENWLADFRAFIVDWPLGSHASSPWCPGCKVHDGFAGAHDELRSEVKSALVELECNSTAVVGHSLGAAVASLAAMDLRSTFEGLKVGPVYTYGEPRVGNRAYVDAFLKAAQKHNQQPAQWRVVHFCDAVPRLAPRGLPFFYVHGPLEVYYLEENSSTFRICDGSGEDETCSGSHTLAFCALTHPMDHVHYLGLPMAYKRLPKACTEDNSRRLLLV
eukprot:TRINITY_DN35363_c0_g1_i1.p1 TRINITY_DN35363_c0_g1~~TRINITY_DN35363_c0_g1_i1.p1  ORF type:complete len:313 (+),score=29.81 TRINITY_DN35363_c0_g1_i1:49-987(+)